MAKYTGWIMLFAIAGTLAAVAAIAITEAFVPAGLLVLTTGEWELLAGVFYIIAIFLYLAEGGMTGHHRAVGYAVFGVPRTRVRSFHGVSDREEQHDTAYVNTLEVAEA